MRRADAEVQHAITLKGVFTDWGLIGVFSYLYNFLSTDLEYNEVKLSLSVL